MEYLGEAGMPYSGAQWDFASCEFCEDLIDKVTA